MDAITSAFHDIENSLFDHAPGIFLDPERIRHNLETSFDKQVTQSGESVIQTLNQTPQTEDSFHEHAAVLE